MAEHHITVTVTHHVVADIDQQVIDRALTSEWCADFYRFENEREVVEHIVYNAVVNGWALDRLDGFADLPRSMARVSHAPVGIEYEHEQAD